MSVTPISPIYSAGQGFAEQHSGMRQNQDHLQAALSSGNLASVQQAMTQLQQSVEQNKPPINGIIAAASDNPDETLRTDREALQSALDAGDVGSVQQSLVRLVEDTQEINSAQRAEQPKPLSAMPNLQNFAQDESGPGLSPQKDSGNLIDVMA